MTRSVYIFFGCIAGLAVIFLLFFRNFQLPTIKPIGIEKIASILPTPSSSPILNVEQIFSDDRIEKKENVKDDTWVLIASGDIIPARSVNQQTIRRNDFLWSWKNIIPILSKGDITVINLESPLISNCPVTVDGMVFCGDPRHIEGLKKAHVTVANFANNHMGNYGVKGIDETKQLLKENGILVSGLDETVIVKVKGTKVAFLGFDDIGPYVLPIAQADEESIKKQILEAKNEAEVIIVSMNWGVEYTEKPSERQIFLAHVAIDSGADLIIGNHPHWIQPIEFYKGKMIMYAHGNTIFDQMWSEKTKIGVIGKYTFKGKNLIDVEFIPTYIKDYGQPEIMTGEKKNKIIESMKQISLPLYE